MTATLVPDLLTPLSEEGVLRAMVGGYRLTMGGAPVAGPLSVIGAQAFLECARGKKIHGNNPGNKKKPKDWDGNFAYLRCDELFDERTMRAAKQLGPVVSAAPWRGGPLYRVVLDSPHPWAAFCSFPTPEEGFADYVALLACSDRYRAAWHFVQRGDAEGFSRALHQAGYYTADEATYTRGIVSLSAALLPLCHVILGGQEHELDQEERDMIGSLVALTVADAMWHGDRHTDSLIAEEYPLHDTDPMPGPPESAA